MIELTDNVVNELLDRAIAEKGADYVYPGSGNSNNCRYFENDKTPGCIVGHLMNYVGVTADDVIDHDADDPRNRIEHSDARSALERADIKVSAYAAYMLLRAQENQDNGEPWGEAVRDAREGFNSSETGGL